MNIPSFFEVMKPIEGSRTELSDARWLLQRKYDGSRCLIYFRNGDILIIGRSFKIPWTDYFPEIVRELKAILGRKGVIKEAILDSELTYFDSEGNDIFLTTLANPETKKGLIAKVMVFDLISLNDNSLENLPIENRLEILDGLIPEGYQHVEKVKTYPTSVELFESMKGEGVVLKRKGSLYRHGHCSDWLKIKHLSVEEAIVVGCTEGENSRSVTFGSLILAQVDSNGKLCYVGKTSGFSNDEQNRLYQKMLSLRTIYAQVTCPSSVKVKFWVKPEIVVSVRYGNKTSKGVLRMPVYLGERDDKTTMECNMNQISQAIIKEHSKAKPKPNTVKYEPSMVMAWLQESKEKVGV